MPSYNQFVSTPAKKDIADQAGVLMSFIFNNPTNAVPASSNATIALIVVVALGMMAFASTRKRID